MGVVDRLRDSVNAGESTSNDPNPIIHSDHRLTLRWERRGRAGESRQPQRHRLSTSSILPRAATGVKGILNFISHPNPRARRVWHCTRRRAGHPQAPGARVESAGLGGGDGAGAPMGEATVSERRRGSQAGPGGRRLSVWGRPDPSGASAGSQRSREAEQEAEDCIPPPPACQGPAPCGKLRGSARGSLPHGGGRCGLPVASAGVARACGGPPDNGTYASGGKPRAAGGSDFSWGRLGGRGRRGGSGSSKRGHPPIVSRPAFGKKPRPPPLVLAVPASIITAFRGSGLLHRQACAVTWMEPWVSMALASRSHAVR